MPFTTMSTIVPQSNAWTHEAIASEVMVMTDTIDNENIQLDNIRNHINVCLSYIVKQLNLSASPWYGIWLNGTLETTLHPSGLEWINLATAVTGFVPATQIDYIRRINTVPATPTPKTTDLVGNCRKQDEAELTQLLSFNNLQWRFSIAWAHNGSDLLFFIGNQIATRARPDTATPPTLPYLLWDNIGQAWNQTFTCIAYRKPLLDALYAPNSANPANNYRAKIDLPDAYVDLLTKMVAKRVLEQMREQVPMEIEQTVQAGLQNLNQLVTAQLQHEQDEREKRKYGAQQRAPGAVG